MLTAAIPSPGFFALSEMGKNRRLLWALGIEMKSSSPRIWWGKKDSDSVAALLRRENLGRNEFKVILSPSAGSRLRTWEPEKFAGLADWIMESYDGKVILVGGREDAGLIREIEERMKYKPVNLSGKTTLLEVGALCHACQLFIGVEGGLMHLAAAAAIPIVALYGPMRPDLTRPDRKNFHAVYQRFPCSPCLQLKCPYSATPRGACMDAIGLRDVQEAIGMILPFPTKNQKMNRG